MPHDRYLNLVFQGGGVRGIAYAGALSGMPSHCKIHAVAGTSAGAIVAALLAIGTTPTALKDILSDRELFGLLADAEVERFRRLEAMWRDVAPLWERLRSNETPSWYRVGQVIRKHKGVVRDLAEVWAARGLYGSARIREWLDDRLERKTFDDVVVDDLKIVAADVSQREYVVYERRRHGGRPIAEAVHASLSIPLFFEPFTSGPLHLVDGGILSNYPSYLFVQGRYPTIGFRLEDLAPAEGIASTVDYLKSLLLTMTEAHDKARGEPPYFKSYPILTPPHIPSTKFDLTSRDVDELFHLGRVVSTTVAWDTYSSPTPKVSFYDPKPHETLEFSLRQAYRLWENYANQDLWVDVLKHEATMTVHIERDWSARYDRVGMLEVQGRRPLFMTRLVASAIDETTTARQSLADMAHICRELTPEGPRELIRVPAFNDENRKGFVVFYIPPIAEGQAPRTIHTGFGIPQEFAQTLAKGQPGSVSYVVRKIAAEHVFKLTIRILTDVQLPALTMTADFPGAVEVSGPPEFDQETSVTYHVREFRIAELRVTGEISFRVTIRR